MNPDGQDDHTDKNAAQSSDTVVHFPRDTADILSDTQADAQNATAQDKLFNALGFLFPQNKILTSGLPLPYDEEQGAQIAQIASVNRSEDVADVFILIRTPDQTAETGYRDRVLPMNGFRPESAQGYVQRFQMREVPLAIPHSCAAAADRIAALELRSILLTALH